MSYEVTWKKSVKKDFKRMGFGIAREIKPQISKALAKDLLKYELCTEKKFRGFRKMRLEDYRAIFSLSKKAVLILRVRHRSEVYK